MRRFVESCELEQLRLKNAIRKAKSDFESELTERIGRTPHNQITNDLIRLYWSSPEFAGIVRRISKKLLGRVIKIPPATIDLLCSDCRHVRPRSIRCWGDALRSDRCVDCQTEWERWSEAERAEARRAWDERLKKEREWYESVRRMPYRDYLKTEHWQEFRRFALKRAGYRCQLCNAKNCRLDVHHRTYERIGDENPNDVFVLCVPCHERFHGIDGEVSDE